MPTVEIFGVAGPTAADYRTYYPDDATTAESVVDSFIADGFDGTMTLQIVDTVPGQTHTITGIDGTDHDEPHTVTHDLRIHRRRDHGFATYWRGNLDQAHQWITHNPEPTTAYPDWTAQGSDLHGAVPTTAILPIADLHRAMHEFIDTGHQPTSLQWQEIQSES